RIPAVLSRAGGGPGVRRPRAAVTVGAPRDRAVEPARAHPHGVPHALRADEPARAHRRVALLRTGGGGDRLERGAAAPRPRLADRQRLGRRPLLAQPALISGVPAA